MSVAAILLLGVLVGTAPAQAATTVAWTHTYTSGNLLTSKAGVTLGCAGTATTVSYARDGSTSGSTPGAPNGCGNVQVDKDGNSFVFTGSYDHQPVVTSYTKTGVLRWRAVMPRLCADQSDTERYLDNLTVGGDGHIYASLRTVNPCGDDGVPHNSLVSFTNTSGALRFATQDDHVNTVHGIFPYQSGLLLVHPSSSSYFSYDGKYLSSFLNGEHGGSTVSAVTASGSAVLAKFGTQDGCVEGYTLDALESYAAWGRKWHKPANIGCSAEIAVKAMPDGGLVVFAARRRTTSPYDVYQSEVHRYTPDGNQTWYITLQQPLTAPAEDRLIDVDTTGNILLARHYSYGVTNGQPNQRNNVQVIKVTDAAGSNNHQTVVADTVDSGHPGTYAAPSASTLGIGNGQVYLSTYNSCDSVPNCTRQQVLFAFAVAGIGVDAARGKLWDAALVTAARPFTAYGDSYISGEGDNQNGFVAERGTCHVSNSAWPARVTGDIRLNLTLTWFPACSGATTTDIRQGNGADQPQQFFTQDLNSPSGVVAVSAGGNNIGFRDLIVACIVSNCKTREQQTLANISRLSEPNLQTSLIPFYNDLKTAAGPDADIYVMEYPLVLPSTSCSTANLGVNAFVTALRDSRWSSSLTSWLTGMGLSATQVLADADRGALTFDASEAAIAKNITTQLNAKIESVVTARRDPKFHYVRANYTGGPFEGHTLCSAAPYFNGFFIDAAHPSAVKENISMSYHPNHRGTEAYKQVFVDCRLNHKNCN
ncbi:hypothetical protein BS329_17980 [Amycolatopsis coloradensis]|uniref:Uncharacterized protein n=2 Tax=Amycolatopsis coloradensis TaxID=76021 RepID=A0A1R0KT58_9PSEU|nr:hypothetical protein BS329_17980 [Amycolatopsis coloradensis]